MSIPSEIINYINLVTDVKGLCVVDSDFAIIECLDEDKRKKTGKMAILQWNGRRYFIRYIHTGNDDLVIYTGIYELDVIIEAIMKYPETIEVIELEELNDKTFAIPGEIKEGIDMDMFSIVIGEKTVNLDIALDEDVIIGRSYAFTGLMPYDRLGNIVNWLQCTQSKFDAGLYIVWKLVGFISDDIRGFYSIGDNIYYLPLSDYVFPETVEEFNKSHKNIVSIDNMTFGTFLYKYFKSYAYLDVDDVFKHNTQLFFEDLSECFRIL